MFENEEEEFYFLNLAAQINDYVHNYDAELAVH